MNIETWLKSTKKSMALREAVLSEAGTNIRYMRQLKAGNRTVSVRLAQRLARASKVHTPFAVMRLEDLRPDVWGNDEAA